MTPVKSLASDVPAFFIPAVSEDDDTLFDPYRAAPTSVALVRLMLAKDPGEIDRSIAISKSTRYR